MERLEIAFTDTKGGKDPLYLVSTNIGVAVKRAAINPIWYNGAAE
jgi:hypothetical protein